MPNENRSKIADVISAVEAFFSSSPSQAERGALFTALIERIVLPFHENVFWGDRLLTLGKAQSFFEDQRFRSAFLAIKGSHTYDEYGTPDTIAWRLHTLVWAARCALATQGDFVECGVFKGDMAWVVARVLGSALDTRNFFLYDSFQGFARSLSSSEDYPENPAFFEFANKVYSEPGLYETVCRKFQSFPNVHVIQGFIPESLATAPSQIAFLHIDLNSPAAEIKALEALFDRVVEGGIIVFDDYGWQVFRKQREAEDEFMARRGHHILELPTGQGLVVKHR